MSSNGDLKERSFSFPVADGVNLDGLLLTSGKPSLVMIAHGFEGKPVAFRPLALELAQEHDVLLYAQRGSQFTDEREGLHLRYSRFYGSGGKFTFDAAIHDHTFLTRCLEEDYDHVGHLGHSSGAAIAAFSACDPSLDSQKLHPLYIASPYVVTRSFQDGYLLLLGILRKGPSSCEGLISLGSHSLSDLDIKNPLCVAFGDHDLFLLRSSTPDYFKEKHGQDAVAFFPGNHSLNPRGGLYFGHHKGKSNRALYDDIHGFFRTQFRIGFEG